MSFFHRFPYSFPQCLSSADSLIPSSNAFLPQIPLFLPLMSFFRRFPYITEEGALEPPAKLLWDTHRVITNVRNKKCFFDTDKWAHNKYATFFWYTKIVLAFSTRIVLEILLVQAWYFFVNTNAVLGFKTKIYVNSWFIDQATLFFEKKNFK